jgi:hypothetical protein
MHTHRIGPSTGISDDRKLVIPYQVIRSNGTIVKSQPDKLASGKVLGHGVKVFVVARKIMPDHVAWLMTTEGWIMVSLLESSIILPYSIVSDLLPLNLGKSLFWYDSSSCGTCIIRPANFSKNH